MKTFSDAACAWLSTKKGTVKESSFAIYHHRVNQQLIPDLGRYFLSDISEKVLNEYLREKLNSNRRRGQGVLSWKTVSDLKSILHMILEYASQNGFPKLGSIKLTLPPSAPVSMQILTREEQCRLIEYLITEITPLHLGILISLYSGLRIGEVCGLRWGDIDFQYGTLHVWRTVIRIQDVSAEPGKRTKLVITDPKTVHSFRIIPVPHDILDILEKYRGAPECYLLTNTEKYLEPRRLLAKYKAVLRKAGLPEFSYHTLRHSFASRCVEQDFDIRSLCEIMGHSSVKITMDRYVHPSMEYKKQQMDRLTLPGKNKE